MLKEFIEHIQKTTQPLITNVNGSAFCVTSDGNIEELLPTIFHPYTLDLNSLDALVTMVRTEASEMDAPLYIAVPDCKTVRCFGQSKDYDERCFRQVYYEAHATDVPGWDQKVTLGFEEAQIALRTRFQETPDTLYAMKLVSDISLGAKVIYNDNGIATTITTQKGVALQTNEQIRPLVKLRPYRIGLHADVLIKDKDLIELAKKGKIRGWSFGMYNVKDSMEERADDLPIRHIKALDLDHLTLVVKKSPIYSATSVELRAGEDIELETRASLDEPTLSGPALYTPAFDNSEFRGRIAALK